MFIGVLAFLEGFGGLTRSCADGGRLRVAGVGLVGYPKKAIWSFRLRLHSGLRQSGSVLRTAIVSWALSQALICRAVVAGVLRGGEGRGVVRVRGLRGVRLEFWEERLVLG